MRNEVNCLLDWNARIQDIEAALQRVPQFIDVLVFTVSGHGNAYGIMLQDGFLPFEILASWLHDTRARRKLVIVDTCGAGGLIEHGPGLGGPFEFDRDYAYDAAIFNSLEGARVLTSCARSQSAHEDPSIQHGVFTWLLLESRKYLRGNNDDIITADKAFAFATGCLNQLGHRQTPEKYGPPGDFPFAHAGRRHPIGSAGIQATLAPPFERQASRASIAVQVRVMGRRRLPTYIEVQHKTGGHSIGSRMELITPTYHESDVSFSVEIPFRVIPQLVRSGHPQAVLTSICLRDEAKRVMATETVPWQLTRYSN